MNKISILIVEDNAELSHVFAEILQSDSTVVEVISDGQEALDHLSTIVPGIVVLDMHLPHVSGDKILKYIREDERLKNIRVVVVTANAEMAAIVDDLADIVLIKPVTYAQISTIVSRLAATDG